jgi:quercetin dioxygenase-like cupin family protein
MSLKEFNRSQVFKLQTEIEYSPNAIVSRTLTNRAEGTVTLFAFDSGQGLSEHTTPFEAHVHILEGEAVVNIDGHSSNLKDGEIIIMPANIPHALEAKTAFKMLLTMIKSKV